jgi:hypothetical protein
VKAACWLLQDEAGGSEGTLPRQKQFARSVSYHAQGNRKPKDLSRAGTSQSGVFAL